jgi:CDP-glucose 4,6-dehydratase
MLNDISFLKGKKVMVTGAAGFKGSYFCGALLELGATVYGVITNRIEHQNSAFSVLELKDKINKVYVDISIRDKLIEAVNSIAPDIIVHFAAISRVPDALKDPYRTYMVNVMGTINLMDSVRLVKCCQKLVIISTDHVFGSIEPEALPEKGFEETANVSFGGTYDTSKAAMELIVRSYAETYSSELPEVVITRCSNVFGLGDVNNRRIIPRLIKMALDGKTLEGVYNKHGRQFIHITDAICAYIKTVLYTSKGQEKDKESLKTFHFTMEDYDGTREPFIRMYNIKRIISEIFNADFAEEEEKEYAQNENKVQALNSQYTRNTLQWVPKKALVKGIEELGEWYRNENNFATLKYLIQKDINQIISNLSN